MTRSELAAQPLHQLANSLTRRDSRRRPSPRHTHRYADPYSGRCWYAGPLGVMRLTRSLLEEAS